MRARRRRSRRPNVPTTISIFDYRSASDLGLIFERNNTSFCILCIGIAILRRRLVCLKIALVTTQLTDNKLPNHELRPWMVLLRSQKFGLNNCTQRGDVAPYVNQGRHRFAFDAFPNRYIVLGFYGSTADPLGEAALRALHQNRHFVDDGKACFFGITSDAQDMSQRHVIEQRFSSIRFLWDAEKAMQRAYGAGFGGLWIILNAMLRVVEVIRFREDGSDRRQLFKLLDEVQPASRYLGLELPAPILVLSDVFEPDLCRHLVDLFDQNGGTESGFMQEIDRTAVECFDFSWKRRKDLQITDVGLIQNLRMRIARRIVPEIKKAYQFQVTRIERDLVACYEAESRGHFGPHRDDTVRATMHRKFAVSINLNDEFDGGEISFPEYSARGFKAPVGTAVVFSASILHNVSKVTRGRRYAFLPFLFDEAAEKVRQANLQYLSPPLAVSTVDTRRQ